MDKRKPRSMEWRRKHSVAMHRIVSKLLKLKKMKERQFASEKTLKKRAQKLALTMLRKKIAGKAGGNYASMSPAQKIAIDRLLSNVPKNAVTQLSKRLHPVVRKHEQERVKAARHKVKKEEYDTIDLQPYSRVDLQERGPTHSGQLKSRVASKRTAHRRHKRGHAAVSSFQSGGHKRSDARLRSRADVGNVMKILKLKGGKNPLSGITARQMAVKNNLSGADSAERRRVKSWIKSNEKRARLATRSNQSSKDLNRRKHYHKRDLPLRNDTEIEMMADFLLEGQMDRFEQLYLRGLVPKNKIEITRRIFRDLDNNIRFRRYHDDISTMVEKLIKLIVNDSTVYNKIKQEVQRGNHVNA